MKTDVAVVDQARELSGFVRVGKKNLKSERWNEEVKASVERKESAWKDLLGINNEIMKNIWTFIEEKRRTKRFNYQSKKVEISNLEGSGCKRTELF